MDKTDNTRQPVGTRSMPVTAKRNSVDCSKVKHTCDALIAQGYPVELAQFLYAVTGCGKYTP